MSNVDSLAVNSLRVLSASMITKAKSGHPGICLGSAPILHTLFTRHLNVYAKEANWANRDRFVLSAGHGSALLYALYIVGVKNIKTIKHMNSLKMSFYVMLFGLLVYIVNLKFCTELQILNRPVLWLYVIGLALLPTIISLETINIAIKLIGSTKTAILGALEPLTAIFFGILFFNEHLTLRISIGVLLILFGVFLAVSRKKQSNIQPAGQGNL